jgi:suppressor of tumorigenicity protein 13
LKVDIDEAREVAAQWKIDTCSSVFFPFKKGKEVDKVVGIDPIALERKIAQHSRK